MIRGKYTLVMIGGAESAPTIFICEKHRKRKKIMHCVEIFFLSASFEDIAIFHGIQLSYGTWHFYA